MIAKSRCILYTHVYIKNNSLIVQERALDLDTFFFCIKAVQLATLHAAIRTAVPVYCQC